MKFTDPRLTVRASIIILGIGLYFHQQPLSQHILLELYCMLPFKRIQDRLSHLPAFENTCTGKVSDEQEDRLHEPHISDSQFWTPAPLYELLVHNVKEFN
jgi:hypothetical protein